MNKILFIPNNGREIEDFNLVRSDLNGLNCQITTIALSEKLEKLLQRKNFLYKRITDYKTVNMLKVLKREKTDIIVTDFCGPIANAFLFAANYTGVPTLQIDDGIMDDYSASLKIQPKRLFLTIMGWIMSEITLRGKPLSSFLVTLMAINSPSQFFKKAIEGILKLTCPLPDPSYSEGLNIAVISQFAKDAHITMGVPAEKVFVTGSPRIDQMWQKKFDRNQLVAELCIPENKGVVILATQAIVGSIWTKENRERFIESVCRAMREFPDKQLVIKLHPAENIETYHGILAKIGEDKAIICQNINLYELLDACDLLLVGYSTVALEAMILNKPVIILNLFGAADYMSYVGSGATIGVHSEEDLAPAISKALYNSQVREDLELSRRRFVDKHVYKLDGHASKRIAALIMQLIEESRREKKN